MSDTNNTIAQAGNILMNACHNAANAAGWWGGNGKPDPAKTQCALAKN